MFKKLVTNLPYSPGLLSQMGFYFRRLQKERLSRRLGMFFIVAAVAVQVFSYASPAEATLGCSNNDIVKCGFSTKSELAQKYRNGDGFGHTDIRAIFDYFGVGEAEINAGVDDVIESRASNDFWSTGRGAHCGGEIRRDIPGAQTSIFHRELHCWDSGAYSTYPALRVKNKQGVTMWILKDCGNIATVGPDIPEEDPPELEIKKDLNEPTDGTVEPGDTIKYTLRYRNNGEEGAGFMRIKDRIPAHTTFKDQVFGGANRKLQNGLLEFWHSTPAGGLDYEILGPSSSYDIIQFRVTVNDNAPAGARICNQATIDAINADPDTSQEVCVIVERPAFNCTGLSWSLDPGSRTNGTFTVTADVSLAKIENYVIDPGDGSDPIIIKTSAKTATANHEYPDAQETYEARARVKTDEGQSEVGKCQLSFKPDAEPSFVCTSLTWTLKEDSRTKGTFEVKSSVQNTTIINYVINPGVDGEDPITIKTDQQVATAMFKYPDKKETYQARARVNTTDGRSEVDNCQIAVSIAERPNPEISHEKKAANLTQDIENANNTLARPGDVIEYTLLTTNSGDATAEDFVLPEEIIFDILEYADLANQGGAKFNRRTKTLSWKPVTIEPGETIEKVFTVRVKNPLPNTPISTSDANSFDLVMSNTYVNDLVNIRLPRTPGKNIERFARNLPETGAGSNAIFSALLVTITVYFYMRNRMISKELKMIEKEFRGGV